MSSRIRLRFYSFRESKLEEKIKERVEMVKDLLSDLKIYFDYLNKEAWLEEQTK